MHKGPITCVIADQEGRRVFTAGYDKRLYVWDRATGESRLIGEHRHLVNCLALSEDGRYLASASSDYTVHVYDTRDCSLVRVLYGHADDVDALTFALHDTRLVTTSHDRRVLVFDVATGAIELEFHGHKKDVLSIWVDGERAFTAGDDGKALIWSLLTGELYGEIEPADCDMDAVSGSSELGAFAVGADDGQVRVYDAQDLTLRTAWQAHDLGVKRVVFSPSGRYLLTAGYDHRIKIWSTADQSLVRELPACKYQWERWLDWTADERSILGASFGVRYCEWDVETGRLVSPQQELATPSINDLALSDGLEIATASDDGRFRIGGQEVAQADGTLTNGVGLSADGRYAAWGDHAGRAHLLDREAGRVTRLSLKTGPVNSVDHCAADGLFYIGTYGGLVHAVDPVSGQEICSWRAHAGAVKSVKTDEERVVTCSSDGSIHVFDREDVGRKRVIIGPTGIVNDMAIDGVRGRIAVVSRDRAVRVFDLATGQILFQHTVHRFSIKSVAMQTDGTVISGDYWGHVVIWHPDRDELSPAVRIASNGISALRSVGDIVYASSYNGAVYRILAAGHAEVAFRLFEQESLEQEQEEMVG